METNKSKELYGEALGAIDAAQSILNRYPEIMDNSFSVSANINPIQMLTQILYRNFGHDQVMDFVSKYLSYIVSALEPPIKAYLLSQLKLMFSCSVNPFITSELLRDGIIFDLRNLDIINMFQYCPLDKSVANGEKNGKWYYFGCDDFTLPDQLECSKDLNAVLWYTKNKTIGNRTVWYGHKNQNKAKDKVSLNTKQQKSDGIVTLEYTSKSDGLRDALGAPITIQTPYNNCLHVFLGNTKPVTASTNQQLNEQLNTINIDQAELLKLKKDTEDYISQLNSKLQNQSNNYSLSENQEYIDNINTYIGYLEVIRNSIENNVKLSESTLDLVNSGILMFSYPTATYSLNIAPLGEGVFLIIKNKIFNITNNDLINQKKQINSSIYNNQLNIQTYRSLDKNYYYHKTLFQFNSDYISSLKLFEGKTLVTRLMDALSGCLSLNLNFSWQELLIQNEMKRIVQDIIESDDTVVSDCFFKFDNDQYNAMLERSEAQRLGLNVAPNGHVGNIADAETLMETLNNLPANATQEEITTAIKSCLSKITREIGHEYDNGDSEMMASAFTNMGTNFMETLIETLTYVVAISIISPKIYLLMAINLKIMGSEPNFDVIGFIENYKNLLMGTIKTIRDEIMRIFMEWLMESIGTLAKDLGAKLAMEQIAYYKVLLRRCVDCFKFNQGNTVGWNMAAVDYADIYDTENNEPANTEC